MLLGKALGAQPVGAPVGQHASGLFVFDDTAELAGVGHGVEADDLDGDRRAGFGDGLTAEIVHGAHPAAGFSGHDGVAHADGAALDQHGDDHAATDVDLGFDDGAAGRRVGVGLEIGDVGDELQHVEEVVEPDALLGAGFDEHRVAAPLFGHDAELGELLLDLLDVGVGLVDLVDDDDHRHGGGLGVVDGLDGLRHDAVVGGHHDGPRCR